MPAAYGAATLVPVAGIHAPLPVFGSVTKIGSPSRSAVGEPAAATIEGPTTSGSMRYFPLSAFPSMTAAAAD
ncbi:hypothetical protein GXP70_19605 [Paenibacillus lycopersici]|uniref:Uncharacterized protein n=1 Tax=Paenibacillus lycopersici TaxID=2704462 RepID=A0A6C0FZ91_9BACL|nr:hypothetical protein [Paenibacillus lycopersici]QHT61967.1 hypothetical protein GXP70_19605 [Paenibacillus lycopersici]